jgi:hypothetical protein
VVAECDESGYDSLGIDSVNVFDNPKDAAKFIAEDLNDTIYEMVESGAIDEDEMADETEVLKQVKKLKTGEDAEWDTPEETPVWIKWKVFAK